ncbi:MAG: hypothetical protein JXR31_10670 [Prolixibacteraceae bacterium]|nr:hypothetical protein [Prolixibacteraceae bacterium]
MLTLEIKEKQLSTRENFMVEIEDQNPATQFDEIVGSKAIGIELPINDTNRTILDNPDRFEKMGNINDRRFERAALRHFGQIIQKGTLIVDESKKSYSGWLRDIVGNLAERVSGKYIHQSTLGGKKVFVNKPSYDPDTDDYACPKIFNRHFWRDRGKRSLRTVVAKDLEGNEYNTRQEDGELTWQLFENYNFFLNFPDTGGVATGGYNMPAVVSPMLFLWRAAELILSDHFIFVKENFLQKDAALKKLIIYNNYSIGKQDMEVVTKTIFSTVYDENVIINTPASVITNVAWSVSDLNYSNLLPKITLGKFILSLQNYLNVIFSFNDLNECRIVDRQKLLTEPAYDIDQYMVGEWELGERKDVTVKLSMKHDPRDYALGDNWQDLSDIREHIKEPVQQRPDLDLLTPEMDEIRKVLAEDKYYQYHWYVVAGTDAEMHEEEADILGWEMITIGFQPYFFNDGDKDVEEITTEFSTLRQSDNGYPLVMQKGNADAFKTQPETFSPRLLFYEGDEVASYHSSSLSLDFDGDLGLAGKRWNYWLPFWANRLPATGVFKFPASVYYYIKNNKAILPFRTRHGSFIIDRMEATAGKTDTIKTTLHVFKRESVVGFQSGSVPGSGEGTVEKFNPSFLGVTSTGKPYLINNFGETRIPPAWGTLSPAPFSKTVCIDYDPVNKLLFVGGYNGTLYITDLADVNNMQMKGIKVFTTGNVSAVKYLNGNILIGKDSSENVYVQPDFPDLTAYHDGQSLEGTLDNGYTAKDFLYCDGYYYSCSQAGEIHRTNNPSGNWTQLTDRKADFRKMVKTENKLMTFGKDDNHSDDREFYADKNNPTTWYEFDVEAVQNVYVNEAVALGNDQALITTNLEYGGARIVNSDNSTTIYTPPLAKYCGGACVGNGNQPVIAIREGSGATKLALHIVENWTYLNVPMFFTKLFDYGS